jgi:BolA protein
MSDPLGPIGLQLEAKLQAALAPSTLQVIDESRQHHGHAGAHPSGESHFRVRIASTAFAGKSLVQKHRMVTDALAAELKTRVHALAIEIL